MGGNADGWGGRQREGSSVSPEPGIHRQKMSDVWEELKTANEKIESLEVGEMQTQEGKGSSCCWLWSLMPSPD